MRLLFTLQSQFIETLWANYSEPAKEAGVYIVNACGYDSIPNDIGTLVLQKAFNGLWKVQGKEVWLFDRTMAFIHVGQLVYVESFMSVRKVSVLHIFVHVVW